MECLFCFSALKLSNTTGANLLATNSNHHYVKCIDIYPKSESDLLLAIGQANGRVTLSTFGPSVYDTQGLTGKDLGADFNKKIKNNKDGILNLELKHFDLLLNLFIYVRYLDFIVQFCC